MLTYRDLGLWPELHAQYHAGESYIKLSNTDLDTKYYFVCTGDLEFHTKRSWWRDGIYELQQLLVMECQVGSVS